MSTFGVGPAARSKNVGIPTSQNSRIVGRGLVKNKSGQIVFNPTVNGTDLIDIADPLPPEDGTFAPFNVTITASGTALEPSFTVKYSRPIGVPPIEYIYTDGGALDGIRQYTGVILAVPGSTFPEGVEPDPANVSSSAWHGVGTLTIGMPEVATDTETRGGDDVYVSGENESTSYLYSVVDDFAARVSQAGNVLSYRAYMFVASVTNYASGSPVESMEILHVTEPKTFTYPAS